MIMGKPDTAPRFVRPSSEDQRHSHFLLQRPPEIRTAFFTYRRTPLALPLPWMYYLVYYSVDGPWTTVKVVKLCCRSKPVDDFADWNDYNTIPLPNCGREGYTCTAPHAVPPALACDPQRFLAAAVESFWDENFVYYEMVNQAHYDLHHQAGCSWPANSDTVQMAAYRHWEDVEAEHICAQKWLGHHAVKWRVDREIRFR